MPETLLNRQLTLQFFQSQIGADIIAAVRKITFCGNDGDPIYCRDFLDICRWIKSVNPDIHLTVITNGSYRNHQWWTDLGHVLNEQDEINWSLDGWDQGSNQQYRVRSDWQSIMDGYQAFAQVNTKTYRVWAAIAFAFNEDRLDHMQALADQLGFDLWQLTKSTKFGSHYPDQYGRQDHLQPTKPHLLAQGHRFQRVSTELTNRARPSDGLKQMFWQRATEISPHSAICMIGNKGVFLDSQGRFYPCCWTANRYSHNREWHERAETRFNLWQRSFSDIIKDDFWRQEFLQFRSHECQSKCTPERLQDREHVTEW